MDPFGHVCVIALEGEADLWAPSLARALSVTAPRSSPRIAPRPALAGRQALVVELDGHRFGLLAETGPMPEPDCTRGLATSLFWPDAEAEMARHTGFVTIAAEAPMPDHAGARAQAVALTRLAAAVAEVVPSLGCYWLGAENAVPPSRLARAPADLAEGLWPVDIWLAWHRFGIDREDAALVIGGQTQGLAAYLGFEIEVPPFRARDRVEPVRILFGAAGYLMAMGDVIREGQLVEVLGEKRTRWTLHLNTDGGPPVARLSVLPPGRQPSRDQGR